MNETYLYPYSAAEANKRNELALWRESHKANIACRNAIEETIRQIRQHLMRRLEQAGRIRLQAHSMGTRQHAARTQVGWTLQPHQQTLGRKHLRSNRPQPQ